MSKEIIPHLGSINRGARGCTLVGAGICLALLSLLLSACTGGKAQAVKLRSAHRPLANLARYVDPFVGTIGAGNTFPGATWPFGMVQWSPDTNAGGLSRPGGYSYGDLIIRSFSLTHLSGAGCAAYENVPFMPTVRSPTVPPLPNGSPYSDRFVHTRERAAPGYYAVQLASGIRVQLTATLRTGLGAFLFPPTPRASILIDPGSAAGATSNINGAQSAAVQIAGRDEVTGRATSGGFCGLPAGFTIYFAALFDRPFTHFGTWTGARMHPGSRQAAGSGAGAFLTFDARRDRAVLVKVGISFVSVRNALANLQAEDTASNFDTIRRRAGTEWNRLLNMIQVSGGTSMDRRTFYTALYHALLHPNVFSDVNGQYIGFDSKVHVARGYTQYANFSGWDIYRSEMQLLAWLVPRQTGDMMQSLVADGRQEGRLPKWPLANTSTNEMDGDSADPIIADAYAFGARGFDARSALRLMLEGAEQPGAGPDGYEERPGLADYLRLGYVLGSTGPYGPAATTLEYAVDDFAIAQLAKSLGDDRDYATFLRRAQSWRHLFDPTTGFVEPRTPQGTFPAGFAPTSTTGFAEGNAYQYTWMVPQSLNSLFRAMGGDERVTRRLDAFFTRLNAGPQAPYDWAGNEPGLEVPWEYDFAGNPWRTQEVVRRIARSLYLPAPGGLPGNDDLGAMSSWYVWAALGLYPEIPGVAGFALATPLFSQIEIVRPGGHGVLISTTAGGAGTGAGREEATGAGAGHTYLRSLWVDGRVYDRPWLPLSAVRGDATLRFSLSSAPNKAWGR